MPYSKSFIDQGSSVKIARYWPRSLFAFLWTSTSSQSIKGQKENLANIKASFSDLDLNIYLNQEGGSVSIVFPYSPTVNSSLPV